MDTGLWEGPDCSARAMDMKKKNDFMFVVNFLSASPLSPFFLSHCYTNKRLKKKKSSALLWNQGLILRLPGVLTGLKCNLVGRAQPIVPRKYSERTQNNLN